MENTLSGHSETIKQYSHLADPVEYISNDSIRAQPESGLALCLSGGGYRAMLFHTGVLWRLYEAGLLQELDRISSVSGGSIVAGLLGLNWSRLNFQGSNSSDEFIEYIANPIRHLASRTIDIPAVLLGLFLPGSISNRIAGFYRRYLFGKATLQDLPDHPRFVINAINIQSGALWRFMKPYMRDWKVGEVKSPTIQLAKAVAASSAFPPFLSPVILKLKPSEFTPNSGTLLQKEPYTRRAVLADGGVYDNLGLETAWKRYNSVLVSDAGAPFKAVPEPRVNWFMQFIRTLLLIDNQVRSLRKRQLLQSYKNGLRKGAYWAISSNVKHYKLDDAIPVPFTDSSKMANIGTRLKKLSPELQEKLINWGYAICDTAIRKYFKQELPRPEKLPYEEAGI